MEFLGFNPLHNSFVLNVNGDYVVSHRIKIIEADIN